MNKAIIEVTGVNTFYSVELDGKVFSVEELYDNNTDSSGFAIINTDDETGEVSGGEREKILEAIREYKE